MCSNRRRVLFPDSGGGLPESEVTIAETLKTVGYATACIGKWHLGHLPQFLPTNNGFDDYYGIPYSNDMDRVPDSPRGRQSFLAPKIEYFNVLKLEKLNPEAIRQLGFIYGEQGQLVQAYVLLGKALELEPENLETRGRLGLVCLSAGKPGEH